eukprot:7654485-Ditylum_brightwellii.AAC.1
MEEMHVYDVLLAQDLTYQDEEDKKFKDVHCLIHEAEMENNGMGDECTFKQFLMMKKAWQAINGGFQCRPKDDGSGIM